MDSDWRVSAHAVYVERRQRLLAEYKRALEEIGRFEARRQHLAHELKRLDDAARVFGIDGLTVDDGATAELFDFHFQDGGQPGAFKETALEMLRAAFPNPIKASQLKELVERKLGRVFHEKTPGMTLYRLSQEGVVRRDGYNWFFVPLEQREALKEAAE